MEPIIEVKNLGKKYNIAHMRGGYVALRDVIASVAKNPFSFLKHKAKQAVGLARKEEFWALKGVNFTVNKGEVVGVIGANGAGKSTLLKILSQITPPTEGEVVIRGRVGSLLEVGTGFHPELSGRENIFLNGAILGMKKREIEKKFDEIIAFAGIEKFLDTPVKHYSSGMYVRLAFSVAAHMEPDILLVDEVLAVGDAEFQKKCLGKMNEITKKEGRTIIFVSHNMAAVQILCTRTIMFKTGKIERIGPTNEVISHYNARSAEESFETLQTCGHRRGDGRVRIVGFNMEDEQGNKISAVRSGESAVMSFTYECSNPDAISEVDVGFSINKGSETLAMTYSSYENKVYGKISRNGHFKFFIESIPFSPGLYGISVRVLADGVEADWPKKSAGFLEISDTVKNTGVANRSTDFPIHIMGKWL